MNKIVETMDATGILPEIMDLDFERLKHKLQVRDDGERWTKQMTEDGELEYRRYLTLIKLHPKMSIVPSRLMDGFWHQHILDTKAYREDCQKVFGYFVDHFPYFGIYGEQDQLDLIEAFGETKRIYKARFGCALDRFKAARCEGHACHVESSCACRVEGACKSV
jgi:hypothetical protein